MENKILNTLFDLLVDYYKIKELAVSNANLSYRVLGISISVVFTRGLPHSFCRTIVDKDSRWFALEH